MTLRGRTKDNHTKVLTFVYKLATTVSSLSLVAGLVACNVGAPDPPKKHDESIGAYMCRPSLAWGGNNDINGFSLAADKGIDSNSILVVAGGVAIFGACDQAYRDNASSHFNKVINVLSDVADPEHWDDPHASELLSVGTLDQVTPATFAAALGSWSIGSENNKTISGAIDQIREQTGIVLAIGTDSSNKYSVSDQWVEDFLEVGRTVVWFQGSKKPASRDMPTKPAGKGEDYYGWVSLAPLLRYGDYDPEFLSTVAIDIITFDQDLPDSKRKFWESDDKFDNEGAKDPVEPVLAALEHNTKALKLVDKKINDPRINRLVEKT